MGRKAKKNAPGLQNGSAFERAVSVPRTFELYSSIFSPLGSLPNSVISHYQGIVAYLADLLSPDRNPYADEMKEIIRKDIEIRTRIDEARDSRMRTVDELAKLVPKTGKYVQNKRQVAGRYNAYLQHQRAAEALNNAQFWRGLEDQALKQFLTGARDDKERLSRLYGLKVYLEKNKIGAPEFRQIVKDRIEQILKNDSNPVESFFSGDRVFREKVSSFLVKAKVVASGTLNKSEINDLRQQANWSNQNTREETLKAIDQALSEYFQQSSTNSSDVKTLSDFCATLEKIQKEWKRHGLVAHLDLDDLCFVAAVSEEARQFLADMERHANGPLSSISNGDRIAIGDRKSRMEDLQARVCRSWMARYSAGTRKEFNPCALVVYKQNDQTQVADSLSNVDCQSGFVRVISQDSSLKGQLYFHIKGRKDTILITDDPDTLDRFDQEMGLGTGSVGYGYASTVKRELTSNELARIAHVTHFSPETSCVMIWNKLFKAKQALELESKQIDEQLQSMKSKADDLMMTSPVNQKVKLVVVKDQMPDPPEKNVYYYVINLKKINGPKPSDEMGNVSEERFREYFGLDGEIVNHSYQYSRDRIISFRQWIQAEVQIVLFQAKKDELAKKRRGLERLLLSARSLYLMTKLPDGNLSKWEHNYILIRGENKLIYVLSGGAYEEVKINDWALFYQKFDEAFSSVSEQDEIFLSNEQVNQLISSNGGHTPQTLPQRIVEEGVSDSILDVLFQIEFCNQATDLKLPVYSQLKDTWKQIAVSALNFEQTPHSDGQYPFLVNATDHYRFGLYSKPPVISGFPRAHDKSAFFAAYIRMLPQSLMKDIVKEWEQSRPDRKIKWQDMDGVWAPVIDGQSKGDGNEKSVDKLRRRYFQAKAKPDFYVNVESINSIIARMDFYLSLKTAQKSEVEKLVSDFMDFDRFIAKELSAKETGSKAHQVWCDGLERLKKDYANQVIQKVCDVADHLESDASDAESKSLFSLDYISIEKYSDLVSTVLPLADDTIINSFNKKRNVASVFLSELSKTDELPFKILNGAFERFCDECLGYVFGDEPTSKAIENAIEGLKAVLLERRENLENLNEDVERFCQILCESARQIDAESCFNVHDIKNALITLMVQLSDGLDPYSGYVSKLDNSRYQELRGQKDSRLMEAVREVNRMTQSMRRASEPVKANESNIGQSWARVKRGKGEEEGACRLDCQKSYDGLIQMLERYAGDHDYFHDAIPDFKDDELLKSYTSKRFEYLLSQADFTSIMHEKHFFKIAEAAAGKELIAGIQRKLENEAYREEHLYKLVEVITVFGNDQQKAIVAKRLIDRLYNRNTSTQDLVTICKCLDGFLQDPKVDRSELAGIAQHWDGKSIDLVPDRLDLILNLLGSANDILYNNKLKLLQEKLERLLKEDQFLVQDIEDFCEKYSEDIPRIPEVRDFLNKKVEAAGENWCPKLQSVINKIRLDSTYLEGLQKSMRANFLCYVLKNSYEAVRKGILDAFSFGIGSQPLTCGGLNGLYGNSVEQVLISINDYLGRCFYNERVRAVVERFITPDINQKYGTRFSRIKWQYDINIRYRAGFQKQEEERSLASERIQEKLRDISHALATIESDRQFDAIGSTSAYLGYLEWIKTELTLVLSQMVVNNQINKELLPQLREVLKPIERLPVVKSFRWFLDNLLAFVNRKENDDAFLRELTQAQRQLTSNDLTGAQILEVIRVCWKVEHLPVLFLLSRELATKLYDILSQTQFESTRDQATVQAIKNILSLQYCESDFLVLVEDVTLHHLERAAPADLKSALDTALESLPASNRADWPALSALKPFDPDTHFAESDSDVSSRSRSASETSDTSVLSEISHVEDNLYDQWKSGMDDGDRDLAIQTVKMGYFNSRQQQQKPSSLGSIILGDIVFHGKWTRDGQKCAKALIQNSGEDKKTKKEQWKKATRYARQELRAYRQFLKSNPWIKKKNAHYDLSQVFESYRTMRISGYSDDQRDKVEALLSSQEELEQRRSLTQLMQEENSLFEKAYQEFQVNSEAKPYSDWVNTYIAQRKTSIQSSHRGLSEKDLDAIFAKITDPKTRSTHTLWPELPEKLKKMGCEYGLDHLTGVLDTLGLHHVKQELEDELREFDDLSDHLAQGEPVDFVRLNQLAKQYPCKRDNLKECIVKAIKNLIEDNKDETAFTTQLNEVVRLYARFVYDDEENRQADPLLVAAYCKLRRLLLEAFDGPEGSLQANVKEIKQLALFLVRFDSCGDKPIYTALVAYRVYCLFQTFVQCAQEASVGEARGTQLRNIQALAEALLPLLPELKGDPRFAWIQRFENLLTNFGQNPAQFAVDCIAESQSLRLSESIFSNYGRKIGEYISSPQAPNKSDPIRSFGNVWRGAEAETELESNLVGMADQADDRSSQSNQLFRRRLSLMTRTLENVTDIRKFHDAIKQYNALIIDFSRNVDKPGEDLEQYQEFRDIQDDLCRCFSEQLIPLAHSLVMALNGLSTGEACVVQPLKLASELFLFLRSRLFRAGNNQQLKEAVTAAITSVQTASTIDGCDVIKETVAKIATCMQELVENPAQKITNLDELDPLFQQFNESVDAQHKRNAEYESLKQKVTSALEKLELSPPPSPEQDVSPQRTPQKAGRRKSISSIGSPSRRNSPSKEQAMLNRKTEQIKILVQCLNDPLMDAALRDLIKSSSASISNELNLWAGDFPFQKPNLEEKEQYFTHLCMFCKYVDPVSLSIFARSVITDERVALQRIALLFKAGYGWESLEGGWLAPENQHTDSTTLWEAVIQRADAPIAQFIRYVLFDDGISGDIHSIISALENQLALQPELTRDYARIEGALRTYYKNKWDEKIGERAGNLMQVTGSISPPTDTQKQPRVSDVLFRLDALKPTLMKLSRVPNSLTSSAAPSSGSLASAHSMPAPAATVSPVGRSSSTASASPLTCPAALFSRSRRSMPNLPNGLELCEVSGEGGNCFYRAVGKHLSEGPEQLRGQVSEYLRMNASRYQAFMTDQALVGDLAQAIESGEREFADNIEIAILMNIHQRPIVVLNSSGEIYNPVSDIQQFQNAEPIFVYYQNDHYDALVVKSGFSARQILEDMLNQSSQLGYK